MTRRDGRLLLFLWAAATALFLGPLFLGKTHALGDVMKSFHPWFTFASQEMQAGRLPLWNPYSSCGEPFLANPQIMVFFPPAQLFRFFQFAQGWRLFFVLSQSLWVLSLFLLFRRNGRAGAALGAMAVGWGGFTLVHGEFPGALSALPFVALFLLAATRGARKLLPFATALLLLSGYTQFALYAGLAGGAWILWDALRRRTLRPLPALFAGGLLGIALASPQLFASWEIVKESVRTGMGPAEARAHLLSPFFLIKFLIPGLLSKTASPFAKAVFDPSAWPIAWNWLTTFYIGIPPLVLAAAGLPSLRRRPDLRFWTATALFALALSMGVEPLFSLMRSAVPGMRYMTHFSNIMLLALIPLGALAAAGLQRGNDARPLAFAALGIGVAAAALVAFVPSVRQFTLEHLLGLPSLTPEQHRWVARAGLFSLGLCAAAAPLFALRRGRAAALLLFTVADLWVFGHDLQPTVSDGFYHEPVGLARGLQNSRFRFALDPLMIRQDLRPMVGDTFEEGYQSLRQILVLNTQIPFRIHEAWGYEVFPNRRFTDVRRSLSAERPLSPPLNFLGVRHLLSTRELPPPAKLLARRANALLYENPEALPRVQWVPAARSFSDDERRLSSMSADWDPRKEVLLETGQESFGKGGGSDFLWEDGRPGRLRANGRSEGGWLVWSQTFYPGWESYINGERTPLLRADHAFQAVELPSGNWRVVTIYRPRPFFAALGASLLAAFLLLGGGLVRLRRL